MGLVEEAGEAIIATLLERHGLGLEQLKEINPPAWNDLRDELGRAALRAVRKNLSRALGEN